MSIIQTILQNFQTRVVKKDYTVAMSRPLFAQLPPVQPRLTTIPSFLHKILNHHLPPLLCLRTTSHYQHCIIIQTSSGFLNLDELIPVIGIAETINRMRIIEPF